MLLALLLCSLFIPQQFAPCLSKLSICGEKVPAGLLLLAVYPVTSLLRSHTDTCFHFSVCGDGHRGKSQPPPFLHALARTRAWRASWLTHCGRPFWCINKESEMSKLSLIWITCIYYKKSYTVASLSNLYHEVVGFLSDWIMCSLCIRVECITLLKKIFFLSLPLSSLSILNYSFRWCPVIQHEWHGVVS